MRRVTGLLQVVRGAALRRGRAGRGGRPLSSVPLSPSFPEFRAFKNQLLEEAEGQGRPVLRLDCMKPATALQHYLQPPPLYRPPFQLSLPEVMEKVTAKWAELARMNEEKLVLTKGVRDGIYVSLEALAADGSGNNVIVPEDVYPVYGKILEKTTSSSSVMQYETLTDSFDIQDVLLRARALTDSVDTNSVLLMPHPITPLGRNLTTEELEHIKSWLTEPSAKSPRYLLLDCVYSFNLERDSEKLATLLTLPNVIALYSLAKGWISPFLEPLVVPNHSMSSALAPNNGVVARSNFSSGVGFLHSSSGALRCQVTKKLVDYRLSPVQSSLQQALYTLQQQPDLPVRLETRLRQQWLKLEDKLRKIDPSFNSPESGYFTTITGNWGDLYNECDTVVVPSSVFGAPTTSMSRSVISCLYDIKDDDHATLGTSVHGHSSQEEIPMYHVTTLSNFIKGYDKYSRKYCKSSIPESTFADQFFLLHAHQLAIGFEKATKLLNKLHIEGDKLLVLHTNIKTPASGYVNQEEAEENQLIPHPKGQYVRRNWITVTDLSISPTAPFSTLTGITVEEASTLSLRLQQNHLKEYQAVIPRSVSIMPIAKGCQAKCPFCFSKGSVSNDIKQQRMYEDKVEAVLQAAYNRGAERAVITGGGEPFMFPFPRLLTLISQCSSKFGTVCAISNGYSLSQLSNSARLEALKSLDEAGLTVLSLSRHAVTEDENEKIMWLRTESYKVAQSWREALACNELKSLTKLRWVCVLQKGGIDSMDKMHDYVSFVVSSGANEVCFKELYVSTTVESVYHDHQSNIWSAKHQVPLSLVLEFCESNGFVKIGELPWGAPIYQGVYGNTDRVIKIAAYTEPSVFWERTNGLCRSWNYMANGDVLASLEDKDSQVDVHAFI